MEKLLERFIRYVKIDTQSDDTSSTAPSTMKQFDLLRLLEKELKALGLKEIHLSKQGVLMASLPATKGLEKAPVIGYIAHVDTAPDASGKNVKPIIHKNYNGKDIKLPGNPKEVLKVKDYPNLKKVKGHTLITTDGTTLLGADDKAGVAIIMSLLDYYKAHPEVAHGKIRIGFTPDEEVGRGTENFDVKKFGADFAYTIDGAELGEIEDSTFCAACATVTVKGVIIHPGYAKNKMINATRILSHLIAKLPLNEAPETTEKLQGFYHPYDITGDVTESKVKILLRDFDLKGIEKKSRFLKKLCKDVEKKFKGVKIELEIKEQYKNMKYALKKDPRVVNYAIEATKSAGVKPKLTAIRGGTDGSRLSFMGLLTPNIWDGGQNFHSIREWVSLEWMQKAVDTLVALSSIWAKK